MRRYLALLLLIPAVLAMVAVSAATAAKPKPKALQLRSTSLGRVIVDSKKHTLYMLSSDGKNSSTCSGACASNWPPATAPKKPKVATGLKKGKLTVITRSDGKKQLAYAGHPLYRFIGDSKPGDVNGEGIVAFGGTWDVVGKVGSPVTSAPAASSPAPSPSPSPGYGY
jgi:predicted lipoprotein with Yx(FWY)xxD motif